jgi:hypothetical protein
MGFTKLDSGIIHSSIWFEPVYTRVLWITILAMKDCEGFVGTSSRGLQAAANITKEQFDEAIKCLESTDRDSRSSYYDGRRVERVEGGWMVLNHEKYRMEEEKKREQARERTRRFREKQRLKEDVTQCNVTATLPSVSVSVSDSSSVSLEVKPKEKKPDLPLWRQNTPEGFAEYKKLAEPVFDSLYADHGWIAEQKRYYPNIAVRRTLEKMWIQYWGTEAGWKNKRDAARGKPDYEMDMIRTIERNLKRSACYYGKEEIDEDYKSVTR